MSGGNNVVYLYAELLLMADLKSQMQYLKNKVISGLNDMQYWYQIFNKQAVFTDINALTFFLLIVYAYI